MSGASHGSHCRCWECIDRENRPGAAMPATTTQAASAAEREEAPANSLPDFEECARLIENSEFRARAAAGLEGSVLMTIDQSPEPTELHHFIHEYDDADSYGSAWFLHRLEKVINEARASTATAPSAPTESVEDESTPQEIIADRLIGAWIATHGKQIPWEKAVEILAICTHMPDAERARLLALD